MSGNIRWLGHSFVEFTTGDNKVILFDPWTKDDGNPACPIDTEEIKRADLVLVSHDHFDHIASAAAICKKTRAFLGGPVQTMRRLIEEGFDPGYRIHRRHQKESALCFPGQNLSRSLTCPGK